METNIYAPKRIFLGIILGFVITVSLLMYYIWHLGTNQETELYRYLFAGLVISGFIMVGFITFVFSIMILTIMRSKAISIPYLQNIMRITLGYFFPIVMQTGKIIRIPKQQIMQSFIHVNNQMVIARNIKVEPSKILLLLPHCIQEAECSYKITREIDNCQMCGRCQVADLIKLSKDHEINICVATGGTLARQIVKKVKPQLIIAVACERDLVSGILDSLPLPVYGMLNCRPNGPCFNTGVDLVEIEKGITLFTGDHSNSDIKVK